MSDLAPIHDLAPREPLTAETNLIEQWAAVEDAARVVAMLAGRAAPPDDSDGEQQIGLLARTDPGRSEAAVFALHELVATMRVGLDALLGAHGSSANNTQVAAVRLWDEYRRGRAKVLCEAAIALRR